MNVFFILDTMIDTLISVDLYGSEDNVLMFLEKIMPAEHFKNLSKKFIEPRDFESEDNLMVLIPDLLSNEKYQANFPFNTNLMFKGDGSDKTKKIWADKKFASLSFWTKGGSGEVLVEKFAEQFPLISFKAHWMHLPEYCGIYEYADGKVSNSIEIETSELKNWKELIPTKVRKYFGETLTSIKELY